MTLTECVLSCSYACFAEIQAGLDSSLNSSIFDSLVDQEKQDFIESKIMNENSNVNHTKVKNVLVNLDQSITNHFLIPVFE